MGLGLRIIDHDELAPSMEAQVHLLDMSAGWGPMDFKSLAEARRLGYPAADYVGVYAVEKREVLSEVRVIRIPFTTLEGSTQIVSGIQGVATRRDYSGRGLARKLLEEAHQREKAAGIRLALLWTGHAMVAHRLYGSMGYLDVHTPKVAMRFCGARGGKPTGYKLSKVREKDAEIIAALHTEATEGRVGFTPRTLGLLRSLFKLGFVKPESIRMILRDEQVVGYVVLESNPRWTRFDEVVFCREAKLGDVVELLESEAPNRWLLLRNTFVQDASNLLRRRHYTLSDHAYYGLLAASLEGSRSKFTKALGTLDSRFSCHYLDYF
jgi:GNAT superfamily N-acetyltransferase